MSQYSLLFIIAEYSALTLYLISVIDDFYAY